jgi:SpoIIAA-like
MPATLEFEDKDICVLRIAGTLRQSEFAACQAELGKKIDLGSKPRLLVIAENFEGWERRADWNDLDYMLSHGGEIAKIALVGDRRWETSALAFAGAGVRRAPVKFFPLDQLAQARVWLGQ